VRPAVAATLLALVAGVSGCASDNTATTELPTCAEAEDGAAANGVILMAQSVPSATWVPCLRTNLPLGWGFDQLDARDSVSRFWLNSDRDGQKAIEVRLERFCDTRGTTEIPSDRAGMRRFERVTVTTPRFEGERYYAFHGGCITIVFRLSGDSRGEPLALATQTIGAISRGDLRAQVRDSSDGRLSLDPAREGEGAP
jgi:hypothetical protein